MTVSLEGREGVELKGASARTRRLMLRTATDLMQQGATPSVSQAAEAAGVSRATAYRYFPSQAALIGAVVDEALGPILGWQSNSDDAAERVDDLLASSSERIVEFESTFKAALQLSLAQWAADRAGVARQEPPFRRGHRVELLQRAIAPLRERLGRARFARLAQALSLTYGLEVLIVLRDVWGLEAKEVQDVARWAARALVEAALSEDAVDDRRSSRGSPRKRVTAASVD